MLKVKAKIEAEFSTSKQITFEQFCYELLDEGVAEEALIQAFEDGNYVFTKEDA